MISQLTAAQKAKLPPNFTQLNRVSVCRRDNNYKGQLHPLDWLVIMPDSVNAHRLAERLIKMNEDMEEVFTALRRRRR